MLKTRPKIKKLFFTLKAEVFDFFKDNYPIKNKDLYERFPEASRSSLRNYKVMYKKLLLVDGLSVDMIKMLMDIMKNKMTPTHQLSVKEQECIVNIGKWLNERIK